MGRAATAAVTSADVAAFIDALGNLDRTVSDAERIDQLTALERLKAAAAAAQATIAVDFADSQLAAQVRAGVHPKRRGKGIPDQIALARREPAARGKKHLALAQALVREMPGTMALLRAGVITERKAQCAFDESLLLTREGRRQLDERLAGRLERLSDAQAAGAARAIAYALDPTTAVRRVRGATKDRRVWMRPAPDAMAYVTGLLPVAQGVSVFAALDQAAKTAAGSGDARGRGQIMADTLVERVTGQASAGAVPVEIQLVMTDQALLAGAADPARVPGLGPIPAPIARELAAGLGSPEGAPARAWLRRLFTPPESGALVAMDSNRRLFAGQLRKLITLRDQTCRTPWCDAPIRQVDHVHPHVDDGPTSAGNAQGLCQSGNYAKDMPGWSLEVVVDPHADPPQAPGTRPDPWEQRDPRERRDGGRHAVRTITPTGHAYESVAPPLLGHGIDLPQERAPVASRLEDFYASRLAVA